MVRLVFGMTVPHAVLAHAFPVYAMEVLIPDFLAHKETNVSEAEHVLLTSLHVLKYRKVIVIAMVKWVIVMVTVVELHL
jgi:hypothetical protein